MKTSLLPSDSCTSITASSSSMPIAMMPPARGLANADSSVFLMVPLRVPITMKRWSSNSWTASIAASFSPCSASAPDWRSTALAVGADVGDLVDLQPVGAPAVREDQHVGVRRRHEQVVDDVLLAGAHADAALAAPVLRAIGRRLACA